MNNILTFVIPVRHQQNSTDWNSLKRKLAQTVASIARQDATGWNAVVVANHGADLPELPSGFDVKRVDFPPNDLRFPSDSNMAPLYEAIRKDKGRRVVAGMLHAGEMGHVMVVDDDDFVSRRLTSFVAAHPRANGWYLDKGYIWTDGGRFLYRSFEFHQVCGTSHIVRADLFGLPASLEAADEAVVSRKFGSHVFLKDDLAAAGTPLEPLPFEGAVYRTGHAGATTRTRGILRQYFIRKSLLRRPFEIFPRLARLRLRRGRIAAEFFGPGRTS
jgi:hypothetical protein